VWNTTNGEKVFEVAAHRDAITDLDFSPDGRYAASASPGELRVWGIPSPEPAATFRMEAVRTVAFSPDGKRLASGGAREEVYVWDLCTRQPLKNLKNEAAFSERQITRIAFLPDPRGLVTGATGGKLRLWRLPD
jgi:WD40 repeat protein